MVIIHSYKRRDNVKRLRLFVCGLLAASPLVLAGCPQSGSQPSAEEQKKYEEMTKQMYEQETKQMQEHYGPGYPGMKEAAQQKPAAKSAAKQQTKKETKAQKK